MDETQNQITRSPPSPHTTRSCVQPRHDEDTSAFRHTPPDGLVVEDQQHSSPMSPVSTIGQFSSKAKKPSLQLSSTQPCPSTFVVSRVSEVVGPEGGIVDSESGVAHSSPSTSISDARYYIVEVLNAFWVAHVPREEQLKALRIVFVDGVKQGPVRAIQGVRDFLDPSIKDGNSPTDLVFRENVAKTRENWRRVSWEPVEYSNPEAWDKFTKEISNKIAKKWPKSFGRKAKSTYRPHFVYDRNCFQGAAVTLTELSYNEHGFPKQVHCYRPRRNDTIPNIPEWRKAIYAGRVRPWGNSIFGRSWRISLEETVLNFTLLAFIISQVTLSHDINIQDVGYCGVVFAKRYAGPWPSTKWTRWCCLGTRICHLQFHIRYMSISDTAIARLIPQRRSEGLYFHREKDSLILPGAGEDFSPVESRVAIAINTSMDSNLARYSMVTLTDSPTLCLDNFKGNQAWSTMKVSLCGEFTGIAVFQMAICNLLTEWHKRWDFVLDSISNTLKVRLHIGDILDSTRRRKLMFDNSFQKSELYFGILELLRIASEWIHEAMEDLKSLEEDFNISTAQNAPEAARSNWKTLVSYLDKIGKQLVERVQEITNRVKSPRDGACPE